jgi:mannose-6-phosphate isomerase-like protein (cupin superfamily)
MHALTDALLVSPPGAGERLDVLGEKMTVKSSFADGSWTVIEVEKNPDSKVPPHSHPWGEIYYVTSGSMRMMIGGTIYDAPAGTCLHIPPDVVHQPLGPVAPNTRLLNLTGAGAAVQMFRDLARNVSPSNVDRNAVIEILTFYGVSLTMPSA